MENAAENFNTLFSCPHGSRLYGLEHAKSDYDYKNIYLPPLDKILACHRAETVKREWYEDINGVSTKIESEFIPLQKFMRDFFGGQTYALEMAFCIDHPGANVHDGRFVQLVDELKQYLTSNVKSMTGYAINQAMLYSVKGDRLEAIVKVAEYLTERTEKDPSLLHGRVHDVLDDIMALGLNEKYIFKTTTLLNGKEIPSIQLLGKVHHGTISILELHTRVVDMQADYGGRARKAMEDKGVDWKALSHALRVTHEANQLLATGELTFPFTGDTHKMLMDSKMGNMTFDDISALLKQGLDDLEVNKDSTKLPAEDEALREKFDAWMLKSVMMMYGVSHDSTI